MSKSDRVFAAARGQEVDRVPVSAWWHDYLREWSPEGLAAATVEDYRKYDWDFIKVNPRACFYAEDWGSRFLASGQPDRSPELIEPAVKSPPDLRRIAPLDVTRGAYGQQLTALAIIARELAGEAPFIQTVFSPLHLLRHCGVGLRRSHLCQRFRPFRPALRCDCAGGR
jgi:uroporphyrinogen decarboxylase